MTRPADWLATTEQVDFSKLNNSDREYFQRHRNFAGSRAR